MSIRFHESNDFVYDMLPVRGYWFWRAEQSCAEGMNTWCVRRKSLTHGSTVLGNKHIWKHTCMHICTHTKTVFELLVYKTSFSIAYDCLWFQFIRFQSVPVKTWCMEVSYLGNKTQWGVLLENNHWRWSNETWQEADYFLITLITVFY